MQIIPLTKDNVLAETMKIKQTRQAQNADIAPIVTKILSQVKQHGDEALKKYTLRFDNVALDTFRVSEKKCKGVKAGGRRLSEPAQTGPCQHLRLSRSAASERLFL